MNKNIIYGFIALLIIVAVINNNSNEEIVIKKDNEVVEENIVKEENKAKKTIEILYLDDEKKVDKQKKDTSKVEKISIVKKDKNIEEVDIENLDSDDIKVYLEKNEMKMITPPLNNNQEALEYSVYANISEEEANKRMDKNLPPMAPTFVKFELPSGEEGNIIIPTSVYNQANSIFVTNNDPEGNPLQGVMISKETNQEEENDNQENIIITPPSIGQ
jgi:hypothetical protein